MFDRREREAGKQGRKEGRRSINIETLIAQIVVGEIQMSQIRRLREQHRDQVRA